MPLFLYVTLNETQLLHNWRICTLYELAQILKSDHLSLHPNPVALTLTLLAYAWCL